MRSIFNGHGYYFNDDRASGGKLQEDDVLTCAHFPCQKVIKKSDWLRNGGFARCPSCDGFLCDQCFDKHINFRNPNAKGCPVFKRVVDEKLNEQYRQQQNAKVLGI